MTAHLNDAVDRKLPTSNEVSFAPHTLLTTMKRGTSGREYQNLAHTVRRLHATHVFTNIRDFDQPRGEEGGFNWITSFRIPKRYSEVRIDHRENARRRGRPVAAMARDAAALALQGARAAQRHPGRASGLFRAYGRDRAVALQARAEGRAGQCRRPGHHLSGADVVRHSGVSGSMKKFTAKLRKIEQEDPLPEYGIVVNRDPDNTSATLFRKTANMPRTRRGVYGSAQAVAGHEESAGFQRPARAPDVDPTRVIGALCGWSRIGWTREHVLSGSAC